MTHEEAKKVAAICSTADNGCEQCVQKLAHMLSATFPEFSWRYLGFDDNERPHIEAWSWRGDHTSEREVKI